MVVLCCREMEGADNPYLDALIRELDDSGDDAVNIEGGGIEPDGDPGDLDVDHDGGAAQEEDQDGDGGGNLVVNVPVPESPHNRTRSVRRYVSSSSAKRRVVKNEHCNFCNGFFDRTTLEDHLNNNEACRILYCRRDHLKTVPAVMVRSFSCLFCDGPGNQLKAHLRMTPRCLHQYFARFEVDSIE